MIPEGYRLQVNGYWLRTTGFGLRKKTTGYRHTLQARGETGYLAAIDYGLQAANHVNARDASRKSAGYWREATGSEITFHARAADCCVAS